MNPEWKGPLTTGAIGVALMLLTMLLVALGAFGFGPVTLLLGTVAGVMIFAPVRKLLGF